MGRIYVDRINTEGDVVNWWSDDLSQGHEVSVANDPSGDVHVLVGAPGAAAEVDAETLAHFDAPDLTAVVLDDQAREAKAEELAAAEAETEAEAATVVAEAAVPAAESDFASMTVAELHELAADAEIPGQSQMNKAELVAALEEAG